MTMVAQIETVDDWAERQGRDPAVSQVRDWVRLGVRPTAEDKGTLVGVSRSLLEAWDQLKVDRGVLMYQLSGEKKGWMVVVPEGERRQVWQEYHRALGHARGRRMVLALRERFHWPGLRRDVEKWQQDCEECLVGSRGKGGSPPFSGLQTSYPWEVLAVDYLSLGRPGDPYPYVLVAIDVFSRFAFAVPTRDQTAATAVRVIWEEVIRHYGCPERLLSDQGPAFESQLVKGLCEAYGCRKVRTTPYHPQGNGACERWNQTLLRLLNTLSAREQGRWTVHVPELVQAYNCTPHSSTGLSPFWVLFGRQPRLPIVQRWGVCDLTAGEAGLEWLQGHRRRLWAACREAARGTEQRRQGDRRYQDTGATHWLLAPGERVLIRNFRRRAAGKVGPYWQASPWVVMKQRDPETPVFQLRPEGRDGPLRTLHRRHLRRCPPGRTSATPEAEGRGAEVDPRPVPPSPRGWPGHRVEQPATGVEDQGEPGTAAEEEESAVAEALPRVEIGSLPQGEAGETLRRSQRVNLGVRPARYRV
uniref:Gypsy retrotransposon integrase-like protein 1 n=1 Tax=Paramormyrops kingsleyae TaxID=1676925 RepID=A0A3B3RCC0_9TELE